MQAAGYTNNNSSFSPSSPPVNLPGIEELDERELEEVRAFIDFLRYKKVVENNA